MIHQRKHIQKVDKTIISKDKQIAEEKDVVTTFLYEKPWNYNTFIVPWMQYKKVKENEP